jgi:hypothetical protein
MNKPPLGVMPKDIWEEKRYIDLLEAISRYIEANKQPPYEWIDELYELSIKLRIRERSGRHEYA